VITSLVFGRDMYKLMAHLATHHNQGFSHPFFALHTMLAARIRVSRNRCLAYILCRTGTTSLTDFEEIEAEMDSVLYAVQRIKDRIQYALALAQRAWVKWVFKPSKQKKASFEPKAA
jgi:hypothetical protein